MAGGTKVYDPFKGSQNAYLFDPILEEWIRLEPMKGGRWYPTLLTLANGDVLAVSGEGENGPRNLRSEVYSTLTGWRFLSNPQDPGWPLYPNLILLQDGALFFSGESTFGANLAPGRLNLGTNTLTPINAPGFDLAHRDQGGTVLLPPAQAQKVMVMGGGGPAPNPTVNTTAIADLSVANPSYVPANPMFTPRMHLNAVLLPDRTVLVSGGESQSEEAATAALEAEIYHPATGQWTRAAKATVPRMWKNGDFINDWAGPPEPVEEITPQGLDRASIEACAGGAFFPGIDAGWSLRDVYEYTEPFRLNGGKLQPGDVTKQMAVPWQADFLRLPGLGRSGLVALSAPGRRTREAAAGPPHGRATW